MIREWLSIQIAKKPAKLVLLTILIFNVLFIVLSTFVISTFQLAGEDELTFFETLFYVVTMVIDPGSITYIVEDIGTTETVVAIASVVVIIIGMITFTGAIIGYVTNWISNFIEESNSGNRKIHISNHIVILNWNTRGTEIIRDLMCLNKREKLIILVEKDKEIIEKDIQELSDEYIGNKLTYIVREGEVFSSRALKDISIECAKTILILDDELNFEEENETKDAKGNIHTVKTLMQTINLTTNNVDEVKVIVEVNDKWTSSLVDKIIESNSAEKVRIYPIKAHMILGQLLSQFSLMPELNVVYQELFSNEDGAFYCKKQQYQNEIDYIKEYLEKHDCAIPLTLMKTMGGEYAYYSAFREEDIDKLSNEKSESIKIKLRNEYSMKPKNIIMLGHNSRCEDILHGFDSFCGEWDCNERKIVNLTIIDSEKNIKKHDYYKNYPFVTKVISANIYDKELICDHIEDMLDRYKGEVSILILSDDRACAAELDTNAFASLIYIKEIFDKKSGEGNIELKKVSVVTEIINSKHHEIARRYSDNNVVISDKYISRMVAQLSEKEPLFEFYQDILTYDSDDDPESKEIYIKSTKEMFAELPECCTCKELVTSVFDASIELDSSNPMIILGYVNEVGKVIVFSKDLTKEKIELTWNDKLIVFSEH